jgi:hypothetical protein
MELPVARAGDMAEIDDEFVVMVHADANDDHGSDLSRHDLEPGAAGHAWPGAVERVLSRQ